MGWVEVDLKIAMGNEGMTDVNVDVKIQSSAEKYQRASA